MNVDLDVRRDHVVGVVGANGAGKSTLGKVPGGALRASTGDRVVADGRRVRRRAAIEGEQMYDLVVVAARPPDWTHERFIEWWRGPHAELTVALPGLRAWRHIEVDRPLDPRSDGWDGVSILSFDNAEDLDVALASAEWQAAVAQVGDMRGRRLALLGSETVLVAPSASLG